MKKYGIIYKCTNLVNNKIYIGQTVYSLEHRRRKHLNNAKTMRYKLYFYKSLNKYGYDNFIWEEIDYANNREELNRKEIEYIKKFQSTNSFIGYNIASGGCNGNNFLGKSEEEMNIIREKQSRARMGQYTKEKHWNFGRHWSDDIRKKMSESGKKRLPDSETTKLNKSIAGRGKILSISTKNKIGEANRGKKRTEFTKKKISISKIGNKYCLGRKYSEDSILKMKKNHADNSGIRNPMFGRKYNWINNNIKEKRIESKPGIILTRGWNYGRLKIIN